MFKSFNGWVLNSDMIIAVSPPNHTKDDSTIRIYVQSGVGDGYSCPSIQISGTREEIKKTHQDITTWLSYINK